MSKPIFTTRRAHRQILEIDAWWRANREKAPSKFADELDLAFRTIETLPGAGQRYPDPTGRDVRRVFLRSTRHHVYYVEEDERVVVVAVWGAVKGTGPDLREV